LFDIIAGLSEFSACKFWISTIGNLDHAFSTILKDSPGVRQLEPQWWMHPLFSEGMTIDVETGQRRSPWLDRKLSEINHDPVLANRLYFADETQQIGGYYAPACYRTMLGGPNSTGTVMPPRHVGELDVVTMKDGPRVARFCEQLNGRWQFWMEFDAAGRPPGNTRYILGVDTAAGNVKTGGRGTSNSVIGVADWQTGDLVAEYVTQGEQPYELAIAAVAAAYWFVGDDGLPALIVPEVRGPGSQFVDCLQRKHFFPNIYRKDLTVEQYGWAKDWRGEEGRLAFGLHQEMICDGRFKERGVECVKEMRHYQHNPNGKGAPVHSGSLLTDDPSGARENHGDRVIARICICQALKRPYRTLPKRGEAPWGSYRYMKDQERRERMADTRLVRYAV
jgi:hypothetical protein